MDNILKEIREHFAANQTGIRPLTLMPNTTPAYTVRIDSEFGVAIDFDSTKDYHEESANALLSTRTFSLLAGNKSKRVIMLSCSDESFRNEFAELCAHFVEPGENCSNRNLLLSDPLAWWNQWIGLLGNKMSSSKTYDVIAEMIALDILYKNDTSIVWAASHSGSHDIESNNRSYEVKSTLKKSETTVTISSQHQLFSQNELSLLFFRFEISEQGYSINDMKGILVGHGYDANLLESQLNRRGYYKGSSIRDQKYRVLEIRSFDVNDDFPKIVESSFKNDVYPNNIIKILYTIDLEGLAYTSITYIPN